MGCWRGAHRSQARRDSRATVVAGDLEPAKVHRMADRLKSFRIRPSARWLEPRRHPLSWPRIWRLAAETEFSAEPTWQPANVDAVYRQLDDYVRSLPSRSASAQRQSAIRDLWWQAAPPTIGRRTCSTGLATCLAEVDERVSELVAFCCEARAADDAARLLLARQQRDAAAGAIQHAALLRPLARPKRLRRRSRSPGPTG